MSLGALGTFLLVKVGPAIIRIRPKDLAKTLRRFKGSKEIKKPTDAQVEKSQTITKDLGNFNKADKKIVAKTIGFTTFAKINNLWLQRRWSSDLLAAATDALFS